MGKNKLVFIWGSRHDPCCGDVVEELSRMGASWVCIEGWRYTVCPALATVPDLDSRRWYEEAAAAFVRPTVADASEWEWARKTEELWGWLEESDLRVINRLSSSLSNASKQAQALVIEEMGFLVPESIVTTDVATACDFVSAHGRVVYKSLSGVRSIINILTSSDLVSGRLSTIENCVTQFQRYVPGDDIRVHVVGTKAVAHRIRSNAPDYRYASRTGCSITVNRDVLPTEVAKRCIDLSQALKLELSGIDLRITEGGEWYCFEANPSPAFSFFEEQDRVGIAELVAAHLCEGI